MIGYEQHHGVESWAEGESTQACSSDVKALATFFMLHDDQMRIFAMFWGICLWNGISALADECEKRNSARGHRDTSEPGPHPDASRDEEGTPKQVGTKHALSHSSPAPRRMLLQPSFCASLDFPALDYGANSTVVE